MDDELKKKLEKLLKSHPELKNKKLVFSDDDLIVSDNTDQSSNETDKVALCRAELLLPDVIRGHSLKIEARKSKIHGYGVFAKEAIEEGEFIEDCKLLKMGWRDKYPVDPTINDYARANNACECLECQTHGVNLYLALGFGSIYNHADTPNTKQNLNYKTEIFNIKAGRRIEKDEEIFVSYGVKYFLIRDFWKEIEKNNALEKMLKEKKR